MGRLGCIAAVLAVALLPATAAAQQRTISVAGNASLSAANDTARVSFAVESVRRSRSAALGAASRRLTAVIATLRRNDVAPADTRTGSIAIRRERVRTRGGRRVTRYRASQGVRAVVRPARRVGEVVDAGVRAGATVSSGPAFFVADTRALQRRALTTAFDDARAKAAALAARAGLTLGRPLSVRESTFVGDDRSEDDSTEQNAGQQPQRQEAAPSPTRPGNTSVEATVFVVFEAN